MFCLGDLIKNLYHLIRRDKPVNLVVFKIAPVPSLVRSS